MATFAPFGFEPIRRFDGGAVRTMRVPLCANYPTALTYYRNQPLTLNGTRNGAIPMGAAHTNLKIVGVCAEFYQQAIKTTANMALQEKQFILVYDVDHIFKVQANKASTATTYRTYFNNNANLGTKTNYTPDLGSTITGLSYANLQATAMVAATAKCFRVLDVDRGVGAVAREANPILIGMFNVGYTYKNAATIA
jgi:hypothetical protein